ncbi:MAG TPA: hypothetical protein VIW29_18560 [Polyangiaceae bacterium]
MTARARNLGWLGLTLGYLLETPGAHAYEAEVDASLDAQYYTYQGPWGDPLVRERRYTTTLGLAVWNITSEAEPRAARLSFQSRMRLDADFGQSSAERQLGSPYYVPGLEEAPLDLMYAYLEGERFFNGYLGFRVGRQYVFDTLGFWSFDGGLVSLSTPIGLVVEAYAGYEQRGGGLPYFGTQRFEPQGVYRGDREGYDPSYYPMFLEEQTLAPAAGVAVEASAFGVLHSRLSYRKVINRDEVNVSPFADAGSGLYYLSGNRVSSNRLGYSLRADSRKVGVLSGELVYDFYNQLFSEYGVTADVYVTSGLTLGAAFERYTPTFDGDSIFNWFSHSPTTSALGHAELRFSRRWQTTLSGGARLFETEGDPDSFASDPQPESKHRMLDVLVDAGVRYDYGRGNVELHGGGEGGERGHRYGADVTGRQRFGARYDGLCVLSLWDWSDGLRPDRDATSFAYVLGAGVTPGANFFARSRLGVELEHDMNQLVGHRFRALVTLDLTVLK